jgi:hypothetical protein
MIMASRPDVHASVGTYTLICYASVSVICLSCSTTKNFDSYWFLGGLNQLRDIVISNKKVIALRHANAKGERKCSSYSFLVSALDGVNGQRHAPAALYPRVKDPLYSSYRTLGGPHS